jgi:hypothetical protein
VHLVTYKTGETKVFKKEPKTCTSGAFVKSWLQVDDADPRYGNRNVASSLVGKLLGSSVMPDTSFGVHQGEVGIMMAQAPGETTAKRKKKGEKMKDFMAKLDATQKASLMRQLNELEICDILTGQLDRHGDNYLVDVDARTGEVKVTGIDNDFSFGTPIGGGMDKVPPMGMGITSITAMPPLMGRAMADKFMGLDFDRDIAPQYAGLLSAEQIKGAKMRHNVLREHILMLRREGLLVDNWETWRSRDDESVEEYLRELRVKAIDSQPKGSYGLPPHGCFLTRDFT